MVMIESLRKNVKMSHEIKDVSRQLLLIQLEGDNILHDIACHNRSTAGNKICDGMLDGRSCVTEMDSKDYYCHAISARAVRSKTIWQNGSWSVRLDYLRDIGCHASTLITEWPQQVSFVTFHRLDVVFHNVTAETWRIKGTLYRLKQDQKCR